MSPAAADREGLLASVRRLGPLLREHAEGAERNRRQSAEAVGQVYCGVAPEFARVAF